MSEEKRFDCPSCFAPMVYKGGESLFQTCESCLAPIVVPEELYYGSTMLSASVNFATLGNDVEVDVEQVTNELTPGDDLPNATIAGWEDAKIEQFDVFQEKIGTGTVAEKEVFDLISTESGADVLVNKTLAERAPHEELSVTLDLIRGELATGDKVEAIKIFREAFNVGVLAAKDAVEAIERGEAVDIGKFEKV